MKKKKTKLKPKKSLEPNRCLYCGSYNTTGTKIKGKGLRGQLGQIISVSAELSSQEQIPELKITCKLCSRKYHFIGFTDLDYLKTHIQFSDVSLGNLKHHFPEIHDPLWILKNNLGIARLEKRFQTIRPIEFHVCFKSQSNRGYLNCRKKGSFFRVISVIKV